MNNNEDYALTPDEETELLALLDSLLEVHTGQELIMWIIRVRHPEKWERWKNTKFETVAEMEQRLMADTPEATARRSEFRKRWGLPPTLKFP